MTVERELSEQQLSLLYDRARDIQADFERFHAANPEVYRLLVKFTRQVRDAGREQYSIDSIFHRLRWHYHIELRTEEPFKLNNNFTSRYARLIMAQEADLDGIFEVRVLRA